ELPGRTGPLVEARHPAVAPEEEAARLRLEDELPRALELPARLPVPRPLHLRLELPVSAAHVDHLLHALQRRLVLRMAQHLHHVAGRLMQMEPQSVVDLAHDSLPYPFMISSRWSAVAPVVSCHSSSINRAIDPHRLLGDVVPGEGRLRGQAAVPAHPARGFEVP